MSKSAMNLQDSFLNQVRRENTEVNVLLVNGTALRGFVKGFDNFTVIMNNRDGQHLLYKHAVAQIVSKRPANIKHEGDVDSANDGASTESRPQASSRPQGAEKSQKPRKEVFNKIDLSQVQLSEPQR